LLGTTASYKHLPSSKISGGCGPACIH